ncbi:hypothetical protein [Pseudoteredinibacter isoporae]|uniref:hypothetical protein n=1 Tax=Pseudoteredinibacter isoporae TaxID=570281 RepID=UPI00310B5316
MSQIIHKFGAGEAVTFPEIGAYVRLLKGKGAVSIRADNGETAEAVVGVEYNLSEPVIKQDDLGEYIAGSRPFKNLHIKSEIEQEITLEISYFGVKDSRLTGDIDVNGILSVVNAGGSSYNPLIIDCVADTALEGVPANIDRVGGVFCADTDGFLWPSNAVADGVGIPYYKGDVASIDNTAAMWFWPKDAGKIYCMESLK